MAASKPGPEPYSTQQVFYLLQLPRLGVHCVQSVLHAAYLLSQLLSLTTTSRNKIIQRLTSSKQKLARYSWGGTHHRTVRKQRHTMQNPQGPKQKKAEHYTTMSHVTSCEQKCIFLRNDFSSRNRSTGFKNEGASRRPGRVGPDKTFFFLPNKVKNCPCQEG